MNKDILRKLGFSKEVDAVENGICPLCKKEVDVSLLRDIASKAEYRISGMCMKCQDRMFGV